MDARLPDGVVAGHWTDREGWTGCTAVLVPDGAVAAGEVRGGGPGTRESELLYPAAAAPDVHGILFTGGSAHGLGAADGVMRWLEERGIGRETPGGLVPLVPAAVVFDLPLVAPARPGPDDAYAACEAAGSEVERGSVGVGTGCTAGKLLGFESWTKGGLGFASELLGNTQVCALAAVNPFGEVLAEDGSVLAGVWRDGRYERTVDILRGGYVPPQLRSGENTTLVCVITDAKLTKLEAWLVARAATAGTARAVDPSATAVDGDLVWCLATGATTADPFILGALAAHVAAAAIRDAVRSATAAPGCPAANERKTGV
jgi:L-aminopeptidase/D-esterase-like protein